MKENNKKIVSIIIIILLLPYVLTVLIKGEGVLPSRNSTTEERVMVQVTEGVEEITYTTYIIGLLAKEIPQEYSQEAIKAQAVIIRTRLALEAEEDTGEKHIFQESYFNIEDIQKKWGNVESLEMYNKLKEAVEETDKLVLKYDGELAKTPYHLLNTGSTRDGNEVFLSEDYSYLKSVSCPLDIESDKEIAIQTVTYEDLKKVLEIQGMEELKYEDIKVLDTDDMNYVLSVEIQGNVINGEVFREAFYLKSSAFSFQEAGNHSMQITTQGVGHGLGLSQNTAHYMGLEGKTFEEILQYFYEGTEIITK